MRRRVLCLLVLCAAALASRPLGSQADAFYFIQLSDPQFGMFTADRSFEQETANFEFAVAAVNRLRPAFVVITGDLVNKPGEPAQLAEYERIVRSIHSDIVVHQIAGNHDVENSPTPASLAAYRTRMGRDYYGFRHGSLHGIVLNSSLIHTPETAPAELAAQDAWLKTELAKARSTNARHVVVFQHHPWFLKTMDEADDYFNIPRARRESLLALFRDAGVRTLVSGHYHRNAVASDAGVEAITTGPVGMPLGGAKSGLRVFRVAEGGISHRFFEFGELPVELTPPADLRP